MRRRDARGRGLVEQEVGRVRLGDARESRRGPAIEDAAAALAGVGADVDEPVGAPHRRQIVLDHEDRVAGSLQRVERLEQRGAVLRMQPGGRLVEDVDDAEQVGADLRRQPQPLQLAWRERRRAAVEREIAEAERLQRLDARDDIGGDALRRDALFFREVRRAADVERAGVRRAAGGDAARGVGARCGAVVRRRALCAAARPRATFDHIEAPRGRRRKHLRDAIERQSGERADVEPGEGDRERFLLQPLAVACRADRAGHEARHAPFHQRALRRRERVQDVAARAGESAHVRGLGLAAKRGARLGRREPGIDRHRRLLFGEQDPVARLLRQSAPRHVDVDSHRDEDVAQVLPMPRRRPRSDRALADRQRVVGHHQSLGDLVDAAEAMAVRARSLRGVGREILGIEHRLARRVPSGARIEHAQEARDRRHAADRRARSRRAALLLQRDRGR